MLVSLEFFLSVSVCFLGGFSERSIERLKHHFCQSILSQLSLGVFSLLSCVLFCNVVDYLLLPSQCSSVVH